MKRLAKLSIVALAVACIGFGASPWVADVLEALGLRRGFNACRVITLGESGMQVWRFRDAKLDIDDAWLAAEGTLLTPGLEPAEQAARFRWPASQVLSVLEYEDIAAPFGGYQTGWPEAPAAKE